jgi:hypothetical protein
LKRKGPLSLPPRYPRRQYLPDFLAAAHFVRPRLDWVGLVINCGEGIIEAVTSPDTQSNLAAYRDRVISQSNGSKSVTVVEKAVAARLRPNMPTSAILDVIEAQQRAGYALLDGWPVALRASRVAAR